MNVPAEFSESDRGGCAATIRTVPFAMESEVDVFPVTDVGASVTETTLGAGTLNPNGTCVFVALAPREAFDPTVQYRVSVESVTHSLRLTWDVPGKVLIEQDAIPLILDDKVLRW